jgi:hypothetical protein
VSESSWTIGGKIMPHHGISNFKFFEAVINKFKKQEGRDNNIKFNLAIPLPYIFETESAQCSDWLRS